MGSSAQEKDDKSCSKELPKFELANKLLDADFYRDYIQPSIDTSLAGNHLITFETSRSLTIPDFETCFKLLEETSSNDYKRSRKGWLPKEKKLEMRDPLMKYLLLREKEASGRILGFLSFMLTEEDNLEVVYCYEIHLAIEARGKGFGKLLMRTMEAVGAAVPVEKAMLTVFTSNTSAKTFYERLGYEYYDEEPVPPRKKLRNRTTDVPAPSYVIMAKDLS